MALEKKYLQSCECNSIYCGECMINNLTKFNKPKIDTGEIQQIKVRLATLESKLNDIIEQIHTVQLTLNKR